MHMNTYMIALVVYEAVGLDIEVINMYIDVETLLKNDE